MLFNLTIDIDNEQITEFLLNDKNMTRSELKNEINNICYLGMDCIGAMILRKFEIDAVESYVNK